MPATQKPAIRNGTVDFMKLLFTLMVMLFHTNKLFPGGYIAVDFFFIVSGYLMAKSSERRWNNGMPLGSDTLSFLFHKAKGIFPFYFVAFVFSFSITQFVSSSGWKRALLTLFRSPYNFLMLGMAGNYDMGHWVQASWYISAMLLSILLIYPLRKKHRNLFDCVIAPALFLAFVGWAYQTGTGVAGFTIGYQSRLFMYNGLARGIAEMSLGCCCYSFGQKLQTIRFTALGKAAVSFVEWFGYLLVIFCAYRYSQSDKDLVLLLALALSVTLSFSGKGMLASIFNNRFFSFLGSFSLQMYLTHELVKNRILPYIRSHTNFGTFMDKTLGTYLFVYICGTIAAAVICRLLGHLLQKATPKIVNHAKKLFIKSFD